MRCLRLPSTRLLLAIGLAGLIMECIVIQPAFAADKVSLFKVITSKDEIVIGLTDNELAQFEGNNAGGIAKMLVAKGSMSVWQYAVRKASTGDLEQAPLRQARADRQRVAARRTLRLAAEGDSDRRDEGMTALPSFRDGPKDQTTDAQLRIGESRESPKRDCT